MFGMFNKEKPKDEGQGDARAGEQTWAELMAEQKVAQPQELLHEEMIEPDAALAESFTQAGYEGNSPFKNEEVEKADAVNPEAETERQEMLASMRARMSSLFEKGSKNEETPEDDERKAA